MSLEQASILCFSFSLGSAFLSIRNNFEVNYLFAFGSVFLILCAIYFSIIDRKS